MRAIIPIFFLLIINFPCFPGGNVEGYIDYDFFEMCNISNFKKYYNDGFIIYEDNIPNKKYVINKNTNELCGYENNTLVVKISYDENGWITSTEYYLPSHKHWMHTIDLIHDPSESVIIYSDQPHPLELTPTLYIICKSDISDLNTISQNTKDEILLNRWSKIKVIIYKNNLPDSLYIMRNLNSDMKISERFYYDGKIRKVEDFESVTNSDLLYRVYNKSIEFPMQMITVISKETKNPNNLLYKDVLYDNDGRIVSYKLISENGCKEYEHKYSQYMLMEVFNFDKQRFLVKKYGINDLEDAF